jgi:hypothetical protein
MNNDFKSWACRQGRLWLCRPDLDCNHSFSEEHRLTLLGRKLKTGYLWSPLEFYTATVNTIAGGIDRIAYVKRGIVDKIFTPGSVSGTIRGN